MIWFGIGEGSKIATILFGTFFPTVIATYGGVDNVDRTLIRMGQSFGLSWSSIVRKIILPGALPAILPGFRISAAIAIVLLVAAEMIGAEFGVGAYILLAGSLMAIDELIAGVVILSIMGLSVNWLIAGPNASCSGGGCDRARLLQRDLLHDLPKALERGEAFGRPTPYDSCAIPKPAELHPQGPQLRFPHALEELQRKPGDIGTRAQHEQSDRSGPDDGPHPFARLPVEVVDDPCNRRTVPSVSGEPRHETVIVDPG